MLDLFEKIANWFCLVMVLAVGFLYFFFALPPTTPREWVEAVTSEPVTAGAAAKPRNSPPGANGDDNSQQNRASDAELLGMLRKQNPSLAGGVKRFKMKVPRETYDYIAPEASWMPEIKLISSQVLRGKGGNTRLKLNKIAQNSLANKFGLEAGDVIELVDGQILDFNEQSALRYRQMFKGALDRLSDGGDVSITITRGRQPRHLMFSLR